VVPRWAKREGFAGNPRAVAGAKLFAESGCLSCHTYLGVGSRNLQANDLTSIGRARQPLGFFERYVADPRRFGNDVMPRFPLPRRQLLDLAIFLAASKGPQ
jgi:hypothetical protein